MAVVIRMKRTGRRNSPCYRISVADRALSPSGRTLENLGVYDPASTKPELRLSLKVDRAKFWLSQGALPSETVRSIFKREGVYEGVERSMPRKRPGRKVVTKARTNRVTRKAAFAEAKSARRLERVSARRAAAKSAAAEAATE
jgi:small subunit ribosomal protein S16